MVIELAAFYNRSLHYSFHINPPGLYNNIFRTTDVKPYMFNFHRPLFPILDQTFLLNILFSNSFALFFFSELGTKFQTQDDRLNCRFACGNCSF